ncbi:hypothetical protein E4U51_007219 [Claviceps purpurea]|nr:hypothetical protein E4U51_007219 [Claviceps purpurea]
METILRSDLQQLITYETARITNVKSVSSYSWIDTPTPTIAVPGSPPFWSPPIIDHRFPKDTGLYYITENALRLPGSPMADFRLETRLACLWVECEVVGILVDTVRLQLLVSGEACWFEIRATKGTSFWCCHVRRDIKQ